MSKKIALPNNTLGQLIDQTVYSDTDCAFARGFDLPQAVALKVAYDAERSAIKYTADL